MPKSKNAITKSGSKKEGVARSAATGRQLGKRDRRALDKNASVAEKYLELVDSVESRVELQALVSESKLILGRVVRNLGCNSLHVLLQQAVNGRMEAAVGIAGTITIKGRASTKTDRVNCMCAGDHVVIDGGLASAKLSKAQADHVMRVFARMELRVPGGFFSDAVGAAGAAGAGTGEVDADADDFTWDRGEDEAAEAAAEADRKAGLKMRAAILKAGGTKMLEVAAAGTRADADAVVAADRDARAAVAAAVIPTSAPVALAAVEAPIKVKNTGPSRAERRAAAQEAAEIAAEIAVAMAGMKTTTTTADDDDELDLTKI